MGSDDFQPIQGMSDLAPPAIRRWQKLEAQARIVLHRYGYEEIRTPVLEKLSVFERSIGDTTDIVQKEMYVLEDRGGRKLALRPEGTAGVMRFVAGHGQDFQDGRLYYIAPMFRCERPQAGRKRQFHQLGAEAIGTPNARVDAEMIAMQVHLLHDWGLEGASIRLNTRGEPADHAAVQQGFRDLLRPLAGRLCEDCRRRMETNVLRVLDCKQEGCREVVKDLPPVTSFMSEASRAYLKDVCAVLDKLEIAYVLDPGLVRGLDYYRHTVWELTHPALGAQDAISGGGRYGLKMGNREIEGVGFAMGLERVMTALESRHLDDTGEPGTLVWLVTLGDELLDENLELAQTLRMRGIACRMDLVGRSMKAQMRAAGRAGATHVVIRGASEAEKGVYQLKTMADGVQREVTLPDLMEILAAGA